MFPRGRSLGRSPIPNFATLRVDFAHGAKRRDPRERFIARVLSGWNVRLEFQAMLRMRLA